VKDECAKGATEKAPHPLPGRGPSLLHGVLVFHAGGFISFLLHASVELGKCCMCMGTSNRDRFKMHKGVCGREWNGGWGACLRVEGGSRSRGSVVVGDDYADGACGKVHDGDGKTPECAGETRRVSAGAFGKDIFLAILFPCFCRIFTLFKPLNKPCRILYFALFCF
jgi:hypothetical protein